MNNLLSYLSPDILKRCFVFDIRIQLAVYIVLVKHMLSFLIFYGFSTKLKF